MTGTYRVWILPDSKQEAEKISEREGGPGLFGAVPAFQLPSLDLYPAMLAALTRANLITYVTFVGEAVKNLPQEGTYKPSDKPEARITVGHTYRSITVIPQGQSNTQEITVIVAVITMKAKTVQEAIDLYNAVRCGSLQPTASYVGSQAQRKE